MPLLIKNATIKLERWARWIWYWEVVYYLPDQSRLIKRWGITYTRGRARRRMSKTLRLR